MDYEAGEKRKNDQPRRRMRGWTWLLIGVLIGVIGTLLFTQSNLRTVTVYNDVNSSEMMLTATYIIQQATGTAAAILGQQAETIQATAAALDPLAATATALVIQATAQAGS